MTAPAISVDRLTKRFGSLTALAEVCFEVPPASVFGLLGPNGAGKTTAVKVLATLLHPDGGRVVVHGLDVVAEAAAVRRLVGMAGQYAAVDANLTGRENLRLIGRLSQLRRPVFRRRADELLDRFELADAATRPVREYSGGMRRRLDVAAALVARPAVLFLDEPTTGLDLGSRNQLWETIRELVGGGTTVVLTTQYLEEADRLAERVAVIDRGRVIADGSPAALKAMVGATVLEVVLPDVPAAERAAGVLGRLPDVRIERDGSAVRAAGGDGAGLVMAAVRLLDEAGIEPTAMQVRGPTLDEAFLRLTGQAEPVLAAAAGPGPA